MSTSHALKLHESSGSPNSRRIRIYIAEKGIELTKVPVDMGKAEQRSDAYRAINSRQVVPTLVIEDGTSIGEVTAIWTYLEAAFPQTPLLGSTPKEKALITMWERRAEQEGFASAMEAIRNALPGLKGRAISGPHDYEQIPALVDRSKQRARNFFSDLNAHLEATKSSFIAGEHFSIADITAFVTVDFAARVEVPITPEQTALKRWYDAIAARPSAQA